MKKILALFNVISNTKKEFFAFFTHGIVEICTKAAFAPPKTLPKTARTRATERKARFIGRRRRLKGRFVFLGKRLSLSPKKC